jgi:hypothetical protein
MLPQFNNNGYLPPGIHLCTAEELADRFGEGSPERVVETQELLDFVAWAKQAGIDRIIVNGSYVTDKTAPNDVDVVILPGNDYPRDQRPYNEYESRWPFLQIFVAADNADLEAWAIQDFGTDRNLNVKGVIEVFQ